jgi:hypothetical protein
VSCAGSLGALCTKPTYKQEQQAAPGVTENRELTLEFAIFGGAWAPVWGGGGAASRFCGKSARFRASFRVLKLVKKRRTVYLSTIKLAMDNPKIPRSKYALLSFWCSLKNAVSQHSVLMTSGMLIQFIVVQFFLV